MSKKFNLDTKDIQIIEALQEDGRVPFSELGRRIGLSQPAISERMKRLEDRGIILGYGVRLNYEALGLRMLAIIRLKTAHEHIRACLKAFVELPYVTEIHRVTGDDCFVLKVLVPAPEHLATIVDSIGRYGAVTTSVVLKSEPARHIRQSALRADREHIAHDEHPEHQLGINRGPSGVRVVRRQLGANPREVENGRDPPNLVIVWHDGLKIERIEQLALLTLASPHH